MYKISGRFYQRMQSIFLMDGLPLFRVGAAGNPSICSKGGSMNTIKRHDEQVRMVLTFLAMAGFTTAKHIQMVANRSRRGLPEQLIRMGLLLKRNMHPGLTIYGLSKKGADLIGAKKPDIHKIRLGRIEHSLITQAETLTSLEEFEIERYEFEPHAFGKNTRPDAIWITRDGKIIFVEIEISGKSLVDGEMDRFFEKLISRDSIVVFTSSALLGRYLQHARRYICDGIPQWKMVDGQWFKTGGVIRTELSMWKNVFFREYEHSPMSIFSYVDEGQISLPHPQ